MFADKVEEPTLTRTPTDKEVREGQKVRFDAAAKGVPKPAMKWWVASPFLILVTTERPKYETTITSTK